MRKFLILLAITFAFVACKKDEEITSLAGTHWKQIPNEYYKEGGCELVFSSTHAILSAPNSDGGYDVFTGEYTFADSKLVITGDIWKFGGWIVQIEQRHTGVMKGQILEMEIWELDMIYEQVEFKRVK